jgi:predicted metal-dependent hydrolase
MTDLDDLRRRVEHHEPFNIADVTDKDPLIRDLWHAVEEQTHRPIYLAQHMAIEPVTAEELADTVPLTLNQANIILRKLGPLYHQRKT